MAADDDGLAMNEEGYWNPMVPELSVTDLTRSLAFYTGLLGFSVRHGRESPPFAYLVQQQVQLMLEQVHQDGWQTGALEAPFGRGINLQMELTDIQPLIERLQRGAGLPSIGHPMNPGIRWGRGYPDSGSVWCRILTVICYGLFNIWVSERPTEGGSILMY